ncbi:MAG TPA: amidase [Vicinamibacteria bacterium]|nr:amidase [Vicinamibacteria bacterium]
MKDIETRRRFLTAFAGSSLLPGVLWAKLQESGGGEIDDAMLADAARVAGVDLSAEERREMLATVNKNLANYAKTRAVDLPFTVVPPLYFNPVVPGSSVRGAAGRFRPSATPPVSRPANVEELAFWPVLRLAALLESRQLTSIELTELYLARLQRYDPRLHCVVTLTGQLAREQARRADEEIAAGQYRGPLHGIPWGAKDLIAKRGYKTTWGSEAFRDQVVDLDATVVTRLEEAGAVLVAKLSTGELARGDRWFGGQTRNPWNLEEGSGGSSAGPGAATAAGLVGFSLGTETLGSIMGPSRICGVTGLRPTYGRVSRHGVMPAAWSLDKVGPMCRSVEDCALVLSAISGPDGMDLSLADRSFDWDGGLDVRTLRVGYLEDAFEEERSGEAASKENDEAVLEVLRSLGVKLEPVALPAHADLDALMMLLVEEASSLDELTRSGRDELLIKDRDEPEAMLLRAHRLVPGVEYFQMSRHRMRLMEEMARLFERVDVYVAPFLTPSGNLNLRATNATGHPGVAVPTGLNAMGTPTSIHLVGKLYGEKELLALAKAYQDATGHHLRYPNLD